MKSQVDKQKARRGVPTDDTDVTARHLNRAQNETKHIHAMFEQELAQRLPQESFEALVPHMTMLGHLMVQSVLWNFCNPHPETFGELRERIASNEKLLPDYFQKQAQLTFADDSAQQAFTDTYRALCKRLETAMTVSLAPAVMLQ